MSRLVEALDAQAATAGVMRLRDWAHAELAARPGERALDVGCGTGSTTIQLADAAGTAVGVEPNAEVRAEAVRRAAGSASFVAGDACALPVSDASIDVLWCERVFQHLKAPSVAAAEFARVLRPGGRVALLDTDWATTILHPGDPRVVAAVSEVPMPQPFAGRMLAGWLSAAGLEIDDVGSQALIRPHDEVAWDLVRMMADGALRRGAISEADRDQLFGELAEAAERGALHFSVTMFGVVAHRP
ncbi:methyltransferase domain-containing protein [Labedaea rhizosphaerae]|uniref:Methyltransferase family protein n=1 Tax=Labedaea rhizosphaerae TaxID=598644 RepID=A0A4R6SEE7_LABRH|nr:methyltransferase domain-containing protein [Labedaea rhizosphaerae]TDP98097.1 methyltransferase family protein [Labedaea rhizosphaerae]